MEGGVYKEVIILGTLGFYVILPTFSAHEIDSITFSKQNQKVLKTESNLELIKILNIIVHFFEDNRLNLELRYITLLRDCLTEIYP